GAAPAACTTRTLATPGSGSVMSSSSSLHAANSAALMASAAPSFHFIMLTLLPALGFCLYTMARWLAQPCRDCADASVVSTCAMAGRVPEQQHRHDRSATGGPRE